MRRIHVHGAGRRGTRAWPGADAVAGVFVEFPDGSTIAEQTRLLEAHAAGSPVVHAHSLGAVPAVLAAQRMPVAGLVLVEPALYDIARGHAAIERHIAIVSEARSQADAGDLRGFWAILRPLMFGGSFDESTWEVERPLAERWATTNLPWGHGVRERMLHGIPTLVVTGGWNDEYEEIARVLVAAGAGHVELPGAEHRPMDLPTFADVVAEFEAGLVTDH